MNLEWDYYYYQLWSNNKQLIQELIDNNNTIEGNDEINNKSYL